MHGAERDVIVLGHAQQLHAQQRPAREVEGTPRLLRGEAPRLRLALVLVHAAQVYDRHVEL
jgi:hypothetical protein